MGSSFCHTAVGEPIYSDGYPRYRPPLSNARQSRDQLRQSFPIVFADNGNDALKKSPHNRMVILGGPGSGKTTLLKYLIANRARESQVNSALPIPIFISLPDLARSGKTLKEYLSYIAQALIVDDSYANVLWSAIVTGRAFICLDSLDEVSPDQRAYMIQYINELASNTSSECVIGSRFTDYKSGQLKQELFTEWELQPMNQTSRNELAERLLPELQKLMHKSDGVVQYNASTFVDALESHSQASSWGENALLFSLAAVIFVRAGKLPLSRVELYQAVITAVLETREPNPARREVLQSVIADLALQLFCQKKGRTFTLHELQTILRTIRKRQYESWSLEEIARRIIDSGILEVVAHETYGFRHQTFQEYLAAAELAQRLISQDQATREEAWIFAWNKRTYSRWTEILRLMVGVLVQNHQREGTQSALRWLRDLTGQQMQPDGDPGYLGLSLALKSCAELVEIKTTNSREMHEIEEEIIKSWITELLSKVEYKYFLQQKRLLSLSVDVNHLSTHAISRGIEQLVTAFVKENASVRSVVVQALGQVRKYISVDLLMTALNDENDRVRIASVGALTQLGEHAPIKRLVVALENGDKDVRRSVALVLGQLGKYTPVEPLVAALKDENAEVRTAAVRALGQLGERAPVEPLLNALNDNELHVRAAAAEALGQLGVRAPVEQLTEALNDGDGLVQTKVSHSLALLGERAPLVRLVALLDNIDYRGRREAVLALGLLGKRAPVERLVATLDDEDAEVRAAAARTLALLGEGIPVEPLVAALDDKEKSVRQAAAWALGQLGESTPMEQLIAVLDNKVLWVHTAVVQILGQLEGRAPLELLLTALNDKREDKRAAAAQALGQLGERAPVEPLVAALKDKKKDVRKAAIKALGQLGEYAPVETLISILENEERFDIRWDVVRALGKLKHRVPVERLVVALNEDVRWISLSVLEQMKEYLPMERLVPALSNSDKNDAVVQALGLLGEHAPLEWLIAILNDENRDMRAAAVHALGRLKERAPVKAIVAALQDNDWKVRLEVAEALGQLGERAPVEPLVTALQDKDFRVRMTAAEALGQLGERAPVEPLVAALQNDDVYVRVKAAEALGQLGERAPIEPLVASLGDSDEQVRVAAAGALGQLGERTSIESLMLALQDKDGYVRAAAAQALGQLGKRAPVEPLIASLGDSEEKVRLEVAQALQRTYPDDLYTAATGMVAFLQGQEPGFIVGSMVQEFIAETIGQLGHSSLALLERLTQLLDWPYWGVRMEAAKSLGKLHRNIPDPAIRRLLKLWHDHGPQAVHEAVDDALATILSLETGIEDD